MTAVCLGPDQTFFFKNDGSSYLPLDGEQATLVGNVTDSDGTDHLLKLSLADGSSWEFQGFSGSQPAERGEFYAAYDTSGNLLQKVVPQPANSQGLLPPSDGQIGAMQWYEGSGSLCKAYKQELYYFNNPAGSPNADRITNIVLQTSADGTTWTNVATASYDYYDGITDTANGGVGDLKDVTTSAGTYYYRYYLYANGSPSHLLKTALSPQQVQAAGGLSNVEGMSDSALSCYASQSFQYGVGDRVTAADIDGQQYSYRYAFGTNMNTANYNNWQFATLETRPDGGVYTVYTNDVGQTVLTDLSVPGQAANQYTRWTYNTSGNNTDLLAKVALPSVITAATANFGGSITLTGVNPSQSQSTIYSYRYTYNDPADGRADRKTYLPNGTLVADAPQAPEGDFAPSGAPTVITTVQANQTLELDSPQSLPGFGTPGGAAVSVDAGATLQIDLGGPDGWTAADLAALLGNANTNFQTGSALDLNVAAGSFTYPYNLPVPTTTSTSTPCPSNLVKSGDGNLTLSGDNTAYTTFSQPTLTVSAGTLEATQAAALPGYGLSGGVTVDLGATLQANLTIDGGSADGWGTADLGSLLVNATFQVDSQTPPSSFSYLALDVPLGSFSYGGLSGGYGLVKLGPGTLGLGSPPSLGSTEVVAGTLDVGAPVVPVLSVASSTAAEAIGDAASASGQWSVPGSGTVTLTASDGDVTQYPDGAWTWTWTPAEIPAGPHAVKITATSSGISVSQTFTVDWLGTTSAGVGVASPATVAADSSVILEATVSADDPTNGTPGGSVNFFDGTTLLATVALDRTGEVSLDGTATAWLSLPPLSVGSHDLTAVYHGAGYFASCTSPGCSVSVAAMDLYWDPKSQGAASEAAVSSTDTWGGTWSNNPAILCWYDPSANDGQGADVAWIDGCNAVFAGAGGTVNISGAVRAASITFAAAGYVVTGATSADSLSLPSGGTSIDVAAAQATIDAAITGCGMLTVTGTGPLTLSGDDTHTGGTTVAAGTELDVYATAAPTAIIAGDFSVGGVLEFHWSADTQFSGQLSGNGTVMICNPVAGSSQTFDILGDNSGFTGRIDTENGIVRLDNPNALGNAAIDFGDPDLTGRTDVGVDSTIDLNGNDVVIQRLDDEGPEATGIITDMNALKGVTHVIVAGGCYYGQIEDGPARQIAVDVIASDGLVLAGNNSYTAGTTIAAGSTLTMGTGGVLAGNVVNDGSLDFAQNDTNSLDFTGNISGTGQVRHDGSAVLALAGVISGGIQVCQCGAGPLTMSGDNTYAGGTQVGYSDANGALWTLVAGSDHALGAAAGGLTMFLGATLDLNGHGLSLGALAGDGGTVTDNSSAPGTTTLTINASGTNAYSGTIANGAQGRDVALDLLGSGSLQLFAACNYSGGTSLQGATLGASAMGSGSLVVNSGRLDLDGHSVTASSASGAALTLADATLGFDLGGAGTEQIATTDPAAVSGDNTIDVATGPSPAPGAYTLITAASGLDGGAFKLENGAAGEVVAIGGDLYTLTLGVSATAVTLTVAADGDAPPTVAAAAAADVSVIGASTTLSVLGDDAAGESCLVYTWSTVSTSNGAQDPVFSVNGTNLAKNTQVSFSSAGSYDLEATIANPLGETATSEVSITVVQSPASISVGGGPLTLQPGAAQQYRAVALDQFGAALTVQPSFTWSLAGGDGNLSSSGVYSAPAAATTATLVASAGGVSGTALVDVSGATVTVPAQASAVPATVTGTTAVLSVLGADPNGEPSLTYTWQATVVPGGASPPQFSGNGTNAAKDTTVTFSSAGTYTFVVTINDPQGGSRTSSVTVPVDAELDAVTVSPGTATVAVNGALLFTAVALDQFGNPLAPQPAISWNASAGTIAEDGSYAAPGSATTVAVTAASGPVAGTASVAVSDSPTAAFTFASGGAVSEGDAGSVSFTPPDGLDTTGFTYSYDFGDQGQFEIADSPSPAAIVPAEYLADAQSSLTVRGRVQDPAGDQADYTTTIPIVNVAPGSRPSPIRPSPWERPWESPFPSAIRASAPTRRRRRHTPARSTGATALRRAPARPRSTPWEVPARRRKARSAGPTYIRRWVNSAFPCCSPTARAAVGSRRSRCK